MNRADWRQAAPRILAWAALFVFCAGLAIAQQAAPASGQRTDGQIEMDVVHALDASQPLKNDLITAATIQGEVTLSGTVALESSKTLAEQIVNGVAGVTAVHNNLKVGNPASDPNAQNGPMVDSNDPGIPETSTQTPIKNPSARDPASPIITLLGNALCHRYPISTPESEKMMTAHWAPSLISGTSR